MTLTKKISVDCVYGDYHKNNYLDRRLYIHIFSYFILTVYINTIDIKFYIIYIQYLSTCTIAIFSENNLT